MLPVEDMMTNVFGEPYADSPKMKEFIAQYNPTIRGTTEIGDKYTAMKIEGYNFAYAGYVYHDDEVYFVAWDAAGFNYGPGCFIDLQKAEQINESNR